MNEVDQEKCPKCSGRIERGYGFAFGGLGCYAFCIEEGCNWFWKEEEAAETIEEKEA